MAYIDCGHCKLVSGGAREKKATPTERPEKNHDGEIKKVTPKKQALPVGDRTEEMDIMVRVMDPCALRVFVCVGDTIF